MFENKCYVRFEIHDTSFYIYLNQTFRQNKQHSTRNVFKLSRNQANKPVITLSLIATKIGSI